MHHSDAASISAHSGDPVEAAAGPEDLAYVIYTSGSTGQPKGVQIPHRAVVNFLTSMAREPGLSADDVLVSVTTLSFDISVLEVFLPLTVGARLVVVSRQVAADGEVLATRLAEVDATAMQATPTTWRLLIEAGWKGDGRLEAMCGGEAWSRELADALLERCGSVWNMYGPTETTIWSAVRRVESGDGPVRIGGPIANTELYVLDGARQPVPIGVPGELYIGGVGLARGYLNRPELTTERFVPDHFAGEVAEGSAEAPDGARLYRTGDLVRYRPDGTIEFLGRLDHQVKIRGFRVELGEIESVLSAHENVHQVVVLAREDVPGDQRLVAYLIAEEEPAPGAAELRRFAQARLPDYMVPTAYVWLDAFPLTPNRKIDRKSLPAPDMAGITSRAAFVAPRSPDEEVLAAIWAEVLRVERVGVEDDFFELGGHSLLATQVISRVREALEVDVPLRALFEAPTVAALADRVASLRREAAGPAAPPLVPVPRDQPLPLSFAQQRLWFFDHLEPGSTAYNMGGAVRLTGWLDADALQSALAEIVRRHEVLRAVISSEGGRPAQRVLPAGPFDLALVDLTSVPDDERTLAVEEEIEAESRRPFNLAEDVKLRARLLRTSEDEHTLLVSVHHIASDGWSLTILGRELSQLYDARSRGVEPSLPELPIQYGDYAAWQRQWLQGDVLESQLAYWRAQLGTDLPTLELPADFQRPAVQTFRGGQHHRVLSPDLSARLLALSRQHGATLFMTLLSAFSLLLSRQAGQSEVVVGAPVAGRNRRELEGLIGFFVNTLVLRIDLSGDPSFVELLRRTREVTLQAQAHQDLPFERLVEELQPKRDLSRTPLFQVMLNMLDIGQEPTELRGLDAEFLVRPELESKFDLTLYAQELEGRIDLLLVYNADLFAEPRMVELLGQLEHLLDALVASPDEPVSRRDLLTREARARLPDPTRPLEPGWEGAVHQRLSMQAARAPEREAVSDGRVRWTYGELEAKSNQLAHALVDSGVAPEEAVAVYAHRSAGLVWALLGVLKAGASFLILDPAYPVRRLVEHLRASQAVALVQLEAAGKLVEELEHHVARRQWRLHLELPADGSTDALSGLPKEAPAIEVDPDQVAYYAFTSGSTGAPKGIVGPHRPLSHFLSWYSERFELTQNDRFSLLSGLAHDPLLRDVFAPFWVGGTLCIPDSAEIQAPDALAAWLRASRVRVAHLTPALGELLLAASDDEESLVDLRLTAFGGDVLTTSLVSRLRRRASACTVVNFYGATETPQAMGYEVVEGNDDGRAHLATFTSVPLGTGIEGVQLLVLTESAGLAGVGELGEIAVRTPYLSHGYVNDAALTAERFVPSPLTGSDTDRVYRTGDLGRYRPDGRVEFVGRRDRQVKIRGFRVELGEVEAVLQLHPAVRSAVVTTHEYGPDDRRLIAYLVTAEATTVTELRNFVRGKLPAYMAPAVLVIVDAIPLTPRGKIDLEALPSPRGHQTSGRGTLVPPRTSMEVLLAQIWRELLEVDEISVHDNFFDLGGHSMLSLQVVARLEEATGLRINPRELILQSLAQVAARCEVQLGAVPDSPKTSLLDRLARPLRRILRPLTRSDD